MPIKIITVGKKHESWVLEGIKRYQKRLTKPFEIEWVILAHSVQEGAAARRDDSQRILSRLNTNDYVILLDENGKLLNSPDLSQLLSMKSQSSKDLVLIIGGAYGVDESIHKRADFIWSLSPLVFPHQLVRLVLVEQLYRAQQIELGHPYHHS